MALTSMPYLTIQELDANGAPYAGGKLFFYAAGTTDKQDTYADANGNSANTNPLILDAAGRGTVFFQPLTYDVVLAASDSADPPTSPIWTRSGITAVPVASSDLDITGTAGVSLSAGDAVILSEGSGGNTAGKWYKADADQTYLSTLAPQIGMVQDDIASGSSGSIRVGGRITGLSGLTAGTLYYISATAGSITSSAPANAMPIAVADSTTSVILQPPTPWASATVPGLVSIGAQTFAGVKTLTTPNLSAPAFTALPTGIGATTYGASASNFTKNANTTLGDVTGVAFAVAASATYLFQFYAVCSAAVAAGNKFAVTGPAAPTSVLISYLTRDSTGGDDAFATATTMTALGAGSYQLVIISGYLVNGANAGTVQLQYAQQTSDASDAIVYAGSYVQALRVA